MRCWRWLYGTKAYSAGDNGVCWPEHCNVLMRANVTPTARIGKGDKEAGENKEIQNAGRIWGEAV